MDQTEGFHEEGGRFQDDHKTWPIGYIQSLLYSEKERNRKRDEGMRENVFA